MSENNGYSAPPCLHLKACRRMQKIIKASVTGGYIARGCNAETCTAFEPYENYVTTKEAWLYAINGVDSIRSGYGDYDVYCEWELKEIAKRRCTQ